MSYGENAHGVAQGPYCAKFSARSAFKVKSAVDSVLPGPCALMLADLVAGIPSPSWGRGVPWFVCLFTCHMLVIFCDALWLRKRCAISCSGVLWAFSAARLAAFRFLAKVCPSFSSTCFLFVSYRSICLLSFSFDASLDLSFNCSVTCIYASEVNIIDFMNSTGYSQDQGITFWTY